MCILPPMTFQLGFNCSTVRQAWTDLFHVPHSELRKMSRLRRPINPHETMKRGIVTLDPVNEFLRDVSDTKVSLFSRECEKCLRVETGCVCVWHTWEPSIMVHLGVFGRCYSRRGWWSGAGGCSIGHGSIRLLWKSHNNGIINISWCQGNSCAIIVKYSNNLRLQQSVILVIASFKCKFPFKARLFG